ncbi:MAG: YqjK-like family protein [Methylotenera sp.]|uniref:YqjK-like family protein n=1 Tax=Methylotenera sp. TaxID=2051956 RepID=UPI002489B029|nr:YqjK-like family protein [Methylotenera sp.]MDI1308901.1 YqjK-like family protein [Methylotenera sp.]
MKKKLASIVERRQLLVTQAAQQRSALAKNLQPLQSSLALADKSLNIVRYVKKHPILIMGLVSLVGLLKPMRAVTWLRRSWVAGLAIRGLRAWLTKSKTTKT